MNKIKLITGSFIIMLGLMIVSAVTPVYAAETSKSGNTEVKPDPKATVTSTAGEQIRDGLNKTGQKGDLTGSIQTVTNVLLFLISAVAVIVIIVAGVKYVVSDGDAAKVKGAKDTIMYAVVGLIVAILAYAIVGFVIANIK